MTFATIFPDKEIDFIVNEEMNEDSETFIIYTDGTGLLVSWLNEQAITNLKAWKEVQMEKDDPCK